MKYLTPELREAFYSQDKNVVKKADKQWKKKLRAYLRRRDNITQGLSKRVQCFFSKTELHDRGIIFIEIKEIISGRKKKSCTVNIGIEHPGTGEIFVLIYVDVSRCVFHQPEGNMDPILQDWYYDELTQMKNGQLQHEILCGSDATILLQFKRLVIKKNGKRRFSWSKDRTK